MAIRHVPQHALPEIAALRWGLVPHWADDVKIGYRLINARSETAADKPAFRKAFRDRRCLILTDGFYEWQKLDGRKQPYYIRRREGKPFAFAGLWDRWNKGEQPLESCTILTTDANELMRPLHDRMPVILDPADFDRWLAARFLGGLARSADCLQVGLGDIILLEFAIEDPLNNLLGLPEFLFLLGDKSSRGRWRKWSSRKRTGLGRGSMPSSSGKEPNGAAT
jgi:hypothetical protein